MKKQGKFWDKDKNGNLINDTDAEKISAEFKPLINKIKNLILEHLGSSCHSIYLTGSIPRGLAVCGESDLDIFVILNPKVSSKKTLTDLKEKCNALLKDKTVSKIDVELWEFYEVLPLAKDANNIKLKETLSIYDAILKTASLCIHGDDLVAILPPISPGLALANIELIELKPDIKFATKSIARNKSPANVSYWCKRVMKNIIRAGFCLVLAKIKEHTRDVDLCHKIFLRHYPQMQEGMDQALSWAYEPAGNASPVLFFLDDFGKEMIAEVDRWMDLNNPERKKELTRDL